MFRKVSLIFKRLNVKPFIRQNQQVIKMIHTRNLAEMTTEQTQDFLNSFDVVLSDCDGVLWHVYETIPYALDTLKTLQDLGKRVYLVSNNSTITVDQYCHKLAKQGLIMKPDQIINSATVISWYLNKINFKDQAFVIASTAFRKTLVESDIRLTAEAPSIDEKNPKFIVRSLEDVKGVKAVVIDFSLFFDWVKLAYAISCLQNKDVLYITGVEDEWISTGHDRRVIGSGPLMDIVTKYSGRKPIRCAKPSEMLKDHVLEKCNIQNPKRCLFIGDTLQYDMKFATMGGFMKLFVESGLDQLKNAKEVGVSPDFFIPNLGMLYPMIESLDKSVNVKQK
ncbi:uncharacterized protein LOC143177069 [Calliopsis andreniformis]|uniref:uncharacterized protein LOC143177069 n=1 Tax=Calliopsis andreniformis TaxID=337506 RepID=UPI003FCE7A14